MHCQAKVLTQVITLSVYVVTNANSYGCSLFDATLTSFLFLCADSAFYIKWSGETADVDVTIKKLLPGNVTVFSNPLN